MGNLDLQPGAGAAQTATGLTQWQRVGNTFVAPSKTFDDIKRGNTSWWLPFLISVVLTYMLFAGITMRIGWQQVATNNMAMNPKQAQRMEQLTPEQRAQGMKVAGVIIEISMAATPVLILIFACLTSLILWGTINFGFGGKATFQQIFAVNMYAYLPRTIVSIMATAAIFAGLAPDSFNLNNMAATNVAYFLSVQDTNRALYALLSQIDIIAIWVAILLSIGIAKVAGKNRSAGFISVFGWWAVWVLLLVAVAYVMS
ncbi:MAG TPA: YIP1 family protein [Terracidiphilus sp.]|nr:YIP1 family protein [Terracidiphilus sp.]